MKVAVGTNRYHISFRNRSEKIVHDAPPPEMVKELALALDVDYDTENPPTLQKIFKRFKTHVKVKPPHRISTTTTICTIATEAGQEIAVGKAYFSRSEVPIVTNTGIRIGPFNREKARKIALGRALAHLPSGFVPHDFQLAYQHAQTEREARKFGLKKESHV